MGRFLRVRIEIDVSKPLERCLDVYLGSGSEVRVIVKYERLPDYCWDYGMIGHVNKECPLEDPNREYNPRALAKYADWLKANPPIKSRKPPNRESPPSKPSTTEKPNPINPIQVDLPSQTPVPQSEITPQNLANAVSHAIETTHKLVTLTELTLPITNPETQHPPNSKIKPPISKTQLYLLFHPKN